MSPQDMNCGRRNPKREPQVRSSELLDAGDVPPSTKRWRVTHPHRHETLKIGDIVIMSQTPVYDHWLIRESDMTLHKLKDEEGQYVHLAEACN